MSHDHGTYLGSVRDLTTLRDRCVIDGDCWRIRQADGKQMPKGKVRRIWVYGLGCTTAVQAAWYFFTGCMPPKGYVVTQAKCCDLSDCVNPQHLICRSRSQDVKLKAKDGRSRSARKTIANRVHGQRRSRMSPELRTWLIESPQTAIDAAHALGIVHSWASALRANHRDRHGAGTWSKTT